MIYILAGLAALMGAAGVASAAAAAHTAADPRLATLSQMLMIHAAAVLALLGFGRTASAPTLYLWAAAAMVAGVALFSGDLAARVHFGDRLFPYAAPLGGALTIGAWLLASIAAAVAFGRR